MRRKLQRKKNRRPKLRLGLPDLDQSKSAFLGSLRSPESQRGYRHAIDEFVEWHCSEPRLSLKLGIPKLAPHDLRRSCARLCHAAGGELEQIQFLLGHVSVQTTERYPGCKQRLRVAVNDQIGIEPAS